MLPTLFRWREYQAVHRGRFVACSVYSKDAGVAVRQPGPGRATAHLSVDVR